jgi:hypothetical protein
MRQHFSVRVAARCLVIAGITTLVWASPSFAGTPLLGPDCGVGAEVVGSDTAGKVTLGTVERGTKVTGLCTLSFAVPYTNPPACSATNETNHGGFPAAMGTRTTTSTLVIGSSLGTTPGDVISYTCADY